MSTESNNLAFSIPPHLLQQQHIPQQQPIPHIQHQHPHQHQHQQQGQSHMLHHHHSNGNLIGDLPPMAAPINLPSGGIISNIAPSSSGSTLGSGAGEFTLHLSNLPHDLTKREASLIFALVIDDIINIEQIGEDIFAYFKTLNTCITTGKLLEGKYLFGNEYLPIKVVDSSYHSINQPFNSLRLSNSNISPPHINTNTTDFQKRQSIGNQRSRFLFSDPFSGSTTPTSATAPGQLQPQQQAQAQSQLQQQSQPQVQSQQTQSQAQAQAQAQVQPQTQQSSGSSSSSDTAVTPSSNGPRIDLSDLSGKSLLLMESQNDAREYEQLVRDPWKSNGSNTSVVNGSQTTLTGATNSTPQTPSATNQGPFDWAAAAAVSSSNQDRRRTSSAFFNVAPIQQAQAPPKPQAQVQPQAQAQVQSQSQSQSQSQGQGQGQTSPPGSLPPQLASQASHLSAQSVAQHQGQQSQPPSQHQTTASTPASQATTLVASHSSELTQLPSSQSPPQPAHSPQSQSVNSRKDVPDLSLLARVPPPANPADQNPPCNTLYVGNLPPDATEVELRALFSPQKGFRRLSFRTKTQSQSNPNANSHNHGPMCFVEFEDVAHATRALAELYGRALPRPGGSNGKGGIRLSFSKNPLGVRGPGNPRRTSSGPVNGSSSSNGNGPSVSSTQPQQQQQQQQQQPQQQQIQQQPQQTQLQVPSSNGIGNYGYLNYHKA